jgi:hypothetical protein
MIGRARPADAAVESTPVPLDDFAVRFRPAEDFVTPLACVTERDQVVDPSRAISRRAPQLAIKATAAVGLIRKP